MVGRGMAACDEALFRFTTSSGYNCAMCTNNL